MDDTIDSANFVARGAGDVGSFSDVTSDVRSQDLIFILRKRVSILQSQRDQAVDEVSQLVHRLNALRYAKGEVEAKLQSLQLHMKELAVGH